MNIVIYARYSAGPQQTVHSIEGQLKECFAYAKRNDYNVIGTYIDEGISGTTDNRPQFKKMVEDSRSKNFKYVLVYQLDRFSRNKFDNATYKAKLKKNGVKVISAREALSDDASGGLMETILEGMAEYYNVELGQKIKRGISIGVDKRLYVGGSIPLGFKIDNEKHFIIDEENAPIIQRIFEMYSTGSSMAEIIRYLNSHQVKTSRGGTFNKNSINRILRNKRYIGTYIYNDVEVPDTIPQIIDISLFEEVQNMMNKKKKAPARAKATIEYILSAKLFCGYCKCAMTGTSGKGKLGKIYRYYDCVNRRRDKSCDKKVVAKEWIEDLVVNETRNLLSKENIDKIAKEVVSLCEKEKDTDTLKRLKKLLKENETAIENLFKALESGQIVDTIAERIAQKKKENEQLKNQIILEEVQYPMPTVDEVRFFMSQFKKGDINDTKYREKLVDTFVNKIYLYDDKMTILYNSQDSHSEISLDDLGSSRVTKLEVGGIELLSY